MKEQKKLMTAKEYAKHVGTAPQTVRRWMRKGLLKFTPPPKNHPHYARLIDSSQPRPKAKPSKPENKKHEPTLLFMVPRKETLSEYESRLIVLAAGICWGMIVAKIMRVIYDKDTEKSKKENENTETAVRRE